MTKDIQDRIKYARLEPIVEHLPFTAILFGNNCIIWNVNEAQLLFDYGFYGKELGIRKTKRGEISRPIELSIYEVYYLMELSALLLYRSGHPVGFDEFRAICLEKNKNFAINFKIYRHFRDKGYVVRPGLKFGELFSIYIKGLGLDHSPYLIQSIVDSTTLDPIEIVRAGRLSHSVKKKYIIAITKDHNSESDENTETPDNIPSENHSSAAPNDNDTTFISFTRIRP